jgi:hypothetical protein
MEQGLQSIGRVLTGELGQLPPFLRHRTWLAPRS